MSPWRSASERECNKVCDSAKCTHPIRLLTASVYGQRSGKIVLMVP